MRKACSVRADDHLGPLEELDYGVDVWVAVIDHDVFSGQVLSHEVDQLVFILDASVHFVLARQVDDHIALFFGEVGHVHGAAGRQQAFLAGGDAGRGRGVDQGVGVVSARRATGGEGGGGCGG